MKKFRYRYPVIAIIILCAVSAASAGGIAWNVKSAINSGVTGGAGALYYVVAAINLSLVIIPLWFVFDATSALIMHTSLVSGFINAR